MVLLLLFYDPQICRRTQREHKQVGEIEVFVGPNYILSVVKDRDPRIGSCADTGHWVRSHLKPVDCLRILKDRIISSHLKDLNEMGLNAHDVPYGTGVSDIPGILQELKEQGFTGNMSIEYETHWETSLPEVAQCIGFVRGYGNAKSW